VLQNVVHKLHQLGRVHQLVGVLDPVLTSLKKQKQNLVCNFCLCSGLQKGTRDELVCAHHGKNPCNVFWHVVI
jgi:hypothetical protein